MSTQVPSGPPDAPPGFARSVPAHAGALAAEGEGAAADPGPAAPLRLPVDLRLTLPELAARVAAALDALGLAAPGDARVRAAPDERTIRYYTTLGLLDRPLALRGRTALYGPKHVAQLVAVKRLQAEGHSLAAVQRQLAAVPASVVLALAGLALDPGDRGLPPGPACGAAPPTAAPSPAPASSAAPAPAAPLPAAPSPLASACAPDGSPAEARASARALFWRAVPASPPGPAPAPLPVSPPEPTAPGDHVAPPPAPGAPFPSVQPASLAATTAPVAPVALAGPASLALVLPLGHGAALHVPVARPPTAAELAPVLAALAPVLPALAAHLPLAARPSAPIPSDAHPADSPAPNPGDPR
jgi:hypothetical protein